MSKLIVPAMSRKSIYDETLKIKRFLMSIGEYTDNLFFPIVEFIEILPFIDDSFSYDYVSDNELPYEYARYVPSTNTMKIRESVYLKAAKRFGRDRFTLAHELGHYFLHRDVVALSLAKPHQKIPIYKDPEWQANTFASMLLMDPTVIKNLSLNQIVKRCGTSFQAAEIALKNAKKSNYIR